MRFTVSNKKSNNQHGTVMKNRTTISTIVMLRKLPVAILFTAVAFAASPSHAGLISVLNSGGPSSMGVAASIIGAPSDALDDLVANSGMQGFDEAQGVVTSVAHATDFGGSIAAGTLVDSHMIFLNSLGPALLSHFDVQWTFDGMIIGIMSDRMGALEAVSTFELGAAGTNYTITGPGTGPAAPFPARGMEGTFTDGSAVNDGYSLVAPNILRVGMFVSEPGDWIRVITSTSVAVPEPGTFILFGIGLAGMGLARRRKKA